MTISSVIIRDEDGNTVFTFDPVPESVGFNMDNSPGKMPMDLPSYHRPYLFFYRSSTRRLVIKTVLLGTDFTSTTILNDLDDLMYIMSGQESDYYQIKVPFKENLSGSPHTYDSSDSDKDNAMFASGDNYMQFFCHPDLLSIDRITRNAVYITLTFSEVNDVTAVS